MYLCGFRYAIKAIMAALRYLVDHRKQLQHLMSRPPRYPKIRHPRTQIPHRLRTLLQGLLIYVLVAVGLEIISDALTATLQNKAPHRVEQVIKA